MKPYKEEDGVFFFNKHDVDIYGCPTLHGYHRFYVIDNEPTYVYTTYEENRGYDLPTLRQPHLYDRLLRFRIIVQQLLGYSLSVAKKVRQSEAWISTMNKVSEVRENHWIECRQILKVSNFSKYYNSIPAIVRQHCYFKEMHCYTEKDFNDIMNMFVKLERTFNMNKQGRCYFPNLRFMALRIMKQLKIPLLFPIPLLINKKRLKQLEDIFISLLFLSDSPPLANSE